MVVHSALHPYTGHAPESAGARREDTFGAVLRARAAAHPARLALVAPPAGRGTARRTWTYAALDRRADRLAAGLAARGIRRGDRVVVQLPRTPEFFETAFALFRTGAVPVFAPASPSRRELSALLSATRAVALVTSGAAGGAPVAGPALAAAARAHAPSVRHVFVAGGDPGYFESLAEVSAEPGELPGPSAGDLAFLQYAGAGTLAPRLVPRSHGDHLRLLRAAGQAGGLDGRSVHLCVPDQGPDPLLASPGPLAVLCAGGRVVLAPDASPDTGFRLIESEQVTVTGLSAATARVWTEAAPHTAYDISGLRVLQVIGGRLGEEAARRVRPALGCSLQQVFGTPEGLLTCTRLDDSPETVATTQGRPVGHGDELRVVDDQDNELPPGCTGHVLARGPHIADAYWNDSAGRPRAFTRDGFHRTGRTGRLTGSGHLVIEGDADRAGA
ncbi:AMP-binding protein [Streptomyces sp. NPDC005805]|uniref:AMP-binding protein n=1 Tax=Streptomyces sp. NPDC005805 TaxID=3157068 RepID=UPI0033D792C4